MSKPPLYEPIYSLRLVELKNFKIYIKSNLANNFIWSFKSFTVAPIVFVKNSTNSLYLYINL